MFKRFMFFDGTVCFVNRALTQSLHVTAEQMALTGESMDGQYHNSKP